MTESYKLPNIHKSLLSVVTHSSEEKSFQASSSRYWTINKPVDEGWNLINSDSLFDTETKAIAR